jgi:hypothetical protein
MVKANVNDPASLVNNSPDALSAKENPPENEPIDSLCPDNYLDDMVAKADALLAVGQLGGIYNCTKANQFQYLSVLSDLVDEIRVGIRKLRSEKS